MRKIFLFFLIFTVPFNSKSQDCNGLLCISNTNIQQLETIICFENTVDSLNWWCDQTELPNESESCVKACELSEYTYATPYHQGSEYSWSVTGGQIISTSNLGSSVIILWDSIGTGTVSVTEIDSLLCSSSSNLCCNIISKPIPSISLSSNSDTICQGSSIQFEAINLSSSDLEQESVCYFFEGEELFFETNYIYELQYLWDFGDGNVSTETNPTYNYANAGTYTVSLSISNACQCYDVTTVDIIVVNTPGPSITTCVGPLCEGDTAEYCTNALLPEWEINGGTIFNSYFSDNCIAIIWDNNDSNLNDGGGELLVGDLDSDCGVSKSFYSVPVVPNTPEINGANITCPGTIESYSFECIPGVDYQWSISSSTGPYPYFIESNLESSVALQFNEWASNYSVELTLEMFSSTLNCSLGQIIFNINILPKITNSLFLNEDACKNEIVTYQDFSGQLYNWDIINGTAVSSSLLSDFIDVNWDQSGSQGVIVVEPTSTGIFCQTSQSFTLNLINTPQPATKILGDSIVCSGEEYIYYIEDLNISNLENVSYTWLITGGLPSTFTGDIATITWDAIGPHSIDVVNQIQSTPSCVSENFNKSINLVQSSPTTIIGSNTVCLNSISTFNLSNQFPLGTIFSWSINSPTLGSVISGQGTEQIQVEWGNVGGIADLVVEIESCGIMYSSSLEISFTSQPISFSVNNSPICSESNLDFTSNLIGGEYYWQFGDNTFSTDSLPSKIYDDPGSYLVSLTFTDPVNQCISSFSEIIDVQGISGSLFPKGTSFFCGSSIISQPLYISTISTAEPIIDWIYNGVVVSTSDSYNVSSLPPNSNGLGEYSVVLNDSIGCSNTLNIINIDTIDCTLGNGWCLGGIGCPPLSPLLYNSTCNSNLGTMLFDFTSPNDSIVAWRVDNGPISYDISYDINFDESGIYNVKALSISYDSLGNISYNNSECLLGSEQVTIPLVVDFDYSAVCDSSSENEISYYFQDLSSYLLGFGSATYLWDFGDGTTSTLHNPVHSFSSNGVFDIDLTINYGGYICAKVITINVSDFSVGYSYSGLECENIPTITFTAFSSPTDISNWSWEFGDGAGSNRQDPRRTFDSSGTYVSSLQISDVNGCLADASLELIIKQTPDINSVTSFGPLCVNDPTVDLNPLLSYNNINVEIVTWAGEGVQYDSITNTYFFNPLFAGGGNHEICATISDINGCFDTECFSVDVLCPKRPKIFGESEYCYTPNVFLNLNTQNIYSDYEWFLDGNSTGISTFSIYDNLSLGSYDYTVLVTDNNGCSIISNPYNVIVNDLPNIIQISSNSNLCPGSEIILSHNGNESGVDYFWNTLPQQTSTLVNTIAIADYKYTVTAVNQFGCVLVSSSIDIPSEISLCGVLSGCLCDDQIINNSGLIDITGLNNTFQYSEYEWLLNGVSFSPSEINSNLVIDPNNTDYLNICSGEITLEVTDYNSCVGVSSPLKIEPNCLNCFGYVYNISEVICVGDSIMFGENFYSSPGIYTEIFPILDGCDSIVVFNLSVIPLQLDYQNISICSGDSLIVGTSMYFENGIYTDTFSTSLGCDSILVTEVEVNNLIGGLNFDFSSLIAYAAGGMYPYTFEIGDESGPIISSTDDSLSININSNGNYYLIVTDGNGCVSDTLFNEVDIFTGNIQLLDIANFYIYPNPAINEFNISFESIYMQDLRLSIVNLMGDKLFFKDYKQLLGDFNTQINLKGNPKGVYFLRIETKDGIINKKLILQ